MAKDSFFVRGLNQVFTSSAVGQVEIDLGAFVNASDGTIVRIHNVAFQFPNPDVTPAASQTDWTRVALSTQSGSTVADMADKSYIAGAICLYSSGDGANEYTTITDRVDASPDIFTNGYLVAVDSLYLQVQNTNSGTALIAATDVSCLIEMSVEKMTKGSAMALALSQQ
jgi:hypothetical protein|tara:strand:- start:1049 stop:1555 length:507 start_codon:yes stop_codon:yes gene_type:complete